MKELFPLNTFQQDAVLKRMNELTNEIKDIEDGDVELPNAKPIYCHPISIDGIRADNSEIHVAMLIFDNSNEEYNNGTKLKAKINSILAVNESAIFPITGAIYYASGSALHIAQKIGKFSDGTYFLTIRPDGTQGNFGISDFVDSENVVVYDGVNKIN